MKKRTKKLLASVLSILLLAVLCTQPLVMAAQVPQGVPEAEGYTEEPMQKAEVTPGTTPEGGVESTPEVMPEEEPGTTPGAEPGAKPGTTPGTTPEGGAVPGTTPEEKPETVPEEKPGTTPEEEPGTTPESTPEDAEKQEPTPEMEKDSEIRITEWNWIEEEEILQWSEENGRWELSFPGVTEEKPLTKELLQQSLPQKISARTMAGENGNLEELALVWDLSAFPESSFQGEYGITAAAPEGYVLDETAERLEVHVVLDSVSLLALQDHLVPGESPQGTTINLFDYWTMEKNPSGGDYAEDDKIAVRSGINAGRQLKFSKGTDPSFNDWTWSENPLTGMLKPTLEEGYPILGENRDLKITADESLAYLFDGTEQEGKEVHEKVKGLLQVDEEGYYYYDSTLNFASYDETSNSFQLYEAPGVNHAGNSPDGQFFPFNKGDEVFTENQWGNLEKKDINSRNAVINHYFGMTMSTRFIQQYDGYADKEQTKKVAYEFSGDDDVWVFIDGVLVADLGGIHDAASLKIDFVTGDIRVNDSPAGTLRDKFRAAGKSQDELNAIFGNSRSSRFKNNTYHTLDFFYLERGNSDSNMKLKFNLVTVPESDIVKIDQLGNSIPGAEFTLYNSDADWSKKEVLATGTTGIDGIFVLVDQEGYTISLRDLRSKGYEYLILEETKVPDGYRDPGTIKLRLMERNNGVILKCMNPLESGGYASAKVTATAPDDVYRYNENGTPPVKVDYKNKGKMFAVVMKYDGSGNMEDVANWCPVYGNEVDGWHIAEDYSMAAIIEAMQKNPYVFQLTASGSHKVDIENLPGDIETYYYMREDGSDLSNVKFSIGYFYTEADNIADADTRNTYRVFDEEFEREFAARLLVPNIGNYFLVQKLDENGNPIPTSVGSATFDLYTEDQVTENEEGNAILKENAVPYDTQTTKDMNRDKGDFLTKESVAGFPTVTVGSNGNAVIANPLTLGTYYVKENTPPPGYKPSDQLIRVDITNDGIYADAGEENDGITVEMGTGSLVKSLLQYANGNVDNTLRDIVTTMQTRPEDNGNWTDTDKKMHLTLGANDALLEYGPANKSGDAPWPGGFTNDSGFSTLKVQQWYEGPDGITSNKEKITSVDDLNHLFAETVVLQVRNQKIGSLTIGKTVEGENAPTDDEFSFTVTLKDAENALISDQYTAVKSDGTTSTLQFVNGEADIQLKNGESMEISGLPADTRYTVTEAERVGYTPSYQVDSGNETQGSTAEGEIPQDGSSRVNFVNRFSQITLSGETALRGTKTLIGRSLTSEDFFAFTLSVSDPATQQAIEGGKIIVAPNGMETFVQGDGTVAAADFTFGDITFRASGRYQFDIKETKGTAEGIVYDEHTAIATVTVYAGADGALTAAVEYSNENAVTETDRAETAKAAFTNRMTGEFAFEKADREENLLGGAGFVLYQLECSDSSHNHGEIISVNKKGDLNGTDTQSGCWKQHQKVDSLEGTGQVSFTELDPTKEYRLIEYRAPGGYTLPKGQWKLAYQVKDGKQGFAITGSVGNPPAFENTGESYRVLNYKPGQLPFTGNIGIKGFLLIGGILMTAGAAALMGWKLKKRKNVILPGSRL